MKKLFLILICVLTVFVFSCTLQEKSGGSIDDDSLKEPASVETYSWTWVDWSDCSVDCGDGIQTREVYCIDSSVNVVDDSNCSEERPLEEQACNIDQCTDAYTWDESGFEDCSVDCGGGFRLQEVTCVDSNLNVVDDSNCDPATKPSELETCNENPCQETYVWKASGWGNCSKNCGGGTRTRDVYCQDSSGNTVNNDLCDSATKPLSEEACNSQVCPDRFTYKGSGWWNMDLDLYEINKIDQRVVSGNFDGDGKEDIAAMYDHGTYINSEGETKHIARIHVWTSTGSEFNWSYASYQNAWWASDSAAERASGGYNANNVTGRMVSGDFTGDGLDDIAVLYDYGEDHNTGDKVTRIHVFRSTGSKFSYTGGSAENAWWASDDKYHYDAEKMTGRVVAGNFNGDKYDDIAVLYDYDKDSDSHNHTRIHVWLSDGSNFVRSGGIEVDSAWYASTSGYNSDNVLFRVVAGNFNGDKYDDIAAFYNYGKGELNNGKEGNITRLHVWTANWNDRKFENWKTWWSNLDTGGYNCENITGRVVVGNFDGEYYDDIAAVFYHGEIDDTITTRIHVWTSTGDDNFDWSGAGSSNSWWASTFDYNSGNPAYRIVAGDFAGDGQDDIAAFYRYGGESNESRIHVWTNREDEW